MRTNQIKRPLACEGQTSREAADEEDGDEIYCRSFDQASRTFRDFTESIISQVAEALDLPAFAPEGDGWRCVLGQR